MSALTLAVLAHLAWQATMTFAAGAADPYSMNKKRNGEVTVWCRNLTIVLALGALALAMRDVIA